MKKNIIKFLKYIGIYSILHRIDDRRKRIVSRMKREIANILFAISDIKNDKIVFDNFQGKGYGDNSKYVAEEILKREKKYDLVWLVKDLETQLPEGIRKVRYGTIRSLYELATARVWIDNVRNTLRPKKKKGQFYLQVWHASGGVKKVEGQIVDILGKNYVHDAKIDGKECDAIVASCEEQERKHRKYFWLNDNTQILRVGCPRNDALFDKEQLQANELEVRSFYKLDLETGILLYMPTFRDDFSLDGYRMKYKEVLDAFEKRFHKKFVMIIRLHPNVQEQSSMLIEYDNQFINGTFFPDVQKLYAATDFLISDYSSAPFDFSILKKPIFLYVPDKKQYEYRLTDIYSKLPFPMAESSDDLIDEILNFDEKEFAVKTAVFMKSWNSYETGCAAKKIVDLLEEITNS